MLFLNVEFDMFYGEFIYVGIRILWCLNIILDEKEFEDEVLRSDVVLH